MTDKKQIISLLEKKIVILDGATGTELQKKGMPAGVCPEIWALKNPDIQESIYRSYAEAGSDIIYTCTFGASSYKLQQYGRDDVEAVNRDLAVMARKAAGSGVLVAGDIGPIGHFIYPFGSIDFEEAVESFKRQIRGLIDGGVDLFVIETQMDIQEARAALIALKETTDAFSLVTMTFEADGRTLNGTSPEAALVTLQSLGADAFGCNCSTGPAEMLKIIEKLKKIAEIPLAAKPNAGMPVISDGKTKFLMGPEEFASYAGRFAAAGANLIGGCCGTSPGHIKALSQAAGLLKIKPYQPSHSGSVSGAAISRQASLSSSREIFTAAPGRPIAVIGERINPTGKKKLQLELLEGKMSAIRKIAAEQEESGADLLDINAGMPGIDEKEKVLEISAMLTLRTGIPLVIDSSSPEVVESFLRLYPGRALINSISGEKNRVEKLLPAAAKYGAMFILLPLADNELPRRHERRIEIIEEIYSKAQKYGFRKKDIIVDGLVMTVSSDPEAAGETLKTIKWASENGFFSVIGLSNISFGLPGRQTINSAFLSMAAANGLSHVIADPGDAALAGHRKASDLLNGRDRDASNYISFFAAPGTASSGAETADIPVTEKIRAGIISGTREDIIPLIKEALESAKIIPQELLEKTMIPAIMHVGDLYESRKYFLPQLVSSAETMNKGVELLQPLLEKNSSGRKGRVLFATVEGDIHDIGKNIVVMMMKNSGFDVLDLGKDVSAEKIISAAENFKPDIIALSALMTTTMVKIPEVIKLAESHNINAQFMAGGAVVTRVWAESIGAIYSKDGVEAVREAEKAVKAIKKRTC